jgi:hypothetical protein
VNVSRDTKQKTTATTRRATCFVVRRCAEGPREEQLAFAAAQSPGLAVGFKQLLAPSMRSLSAHGIHVMSQQANTPKDSSQLAPAAAQAVQLDGVEDPAREYGRWASHLLQVATLPVALL